MARIEILTEEKSMQETLSILLPRILHGNWRLNENYFIRSHEGKSDLQKSIPNKIKVFSKYHEPAGIVIVHDQDSNNCKELKKYLLNICKENGTCPVLIRIACKELESWYLGDMQAISHAYPSFKIAQYRNKAKFRNPEQLNAADELRRILPEFQKVASAKAISIHLSIVEEENKSESYQQFVRGIQNFFSQFEK